MLPSKDWGVELPLMLERQEPENNHLDYKARDALLPPGRGGGGIDRQKRAEDISKDVSSFINSDGGALVYGIRETDDPHSTGGAPIPISEFDATSDGYGRSEMNKEAIENLITGNIEPRPGPELFHVTEVEIDGRIVFVVEAAIGVETAYQAKDFRYYQRFHYKAEPMEHYEIEMVRNRAVAPNLEVIAGLTATWGQEIRLDSSATSNKIEVPIHLGLRNIGSVMAEVALVEVGIFESNCPESLPRHMFYAQDRNISYVIPPGLRHAGYRVNDSIRWHHIRWNPNSMERAYQPLFATLEPLHAAQFNFIVDTGSQGIIGTWCWRVQAPQMPPRQSLMALVYQMPGRLKIMKLDWPFQLDILG